MLKTATILVWVSCVIVRCEGRLPCPVLTELNSEGGRIFYPQDSDQLEVGPLDCDITLTSQAKKIRISFSTLLLPCDEGALFVWSVDGRRLRSYCGTISPPAQEYHRSSIRLQLQLRNRADVRFELEYQYLGITGPPASPTRASCEPRMLREEKGEDGRSGVITLQRIRGQTESCSIRLQGAEGSKKMGVVLVINELYLGTPPDCKDSALVIKRDQMSEADLLCGGISKQSRLYNDWLTVHVQVSVKSVEPVLQLHYIILSDDIMGAFEGSREVDICKDGRCSQLSRPKPADVVALPLWPANEAGCGHASVPVPGYVRERIIGGKVAPIGTWPWIGSLYRKSRFLPFCGASLINQEWVLTAAHCIRGAEYQNIITGHDYSNMAVRFGAHDLREESTASSVDADVDKIIVHPDYNAALGNQDNDIALVKLAWKIEYTEDVKPICLPDKSFDLKLDTFVSIAGWGDDYNEMSPDWAQLKFVWVKTMNQAMCHETYTDRFTDNMFCAGYEIGGKDSCQGDSGGPLIINATDADSLPVYLQVGIVSWGEGCAISSRPGVYTRVSNYVDWIHDLIKTE